MWYVVRIGFSVSKAHAAFMSEQFAAMGEPSDFLVPSRAITCATPSSSRRRSTSFVVDIYNEGIDISQVNTVPFLRPTESLAVYLKQLGRGLRMC